MRGRYLRFLGGLPLLWGCVVLTVALTAGGCKSAPDEPDRASETIDNRDDLRLPDTPAGQAIARHLEVAGAAGPDVESQYQASLQALRAQAADVVPVIVQAYESTDTSQFATRGVLVGTATELRAPVARDFLTRVANEPVPGREAGQDDLVSLRNEESVLRMVAIRGLGYLAAEDDTAASTLVTLVQHDVPAVREEAMRALALAITQTRDVERAARLTKLFPGRYQDWLAIEAGPVPPSDDPRLVPADRGAPDPPTRRP